VVGRVTVAAGVGRESVVWGAEIGGRDDDGGAGEAVLEILHALHLVAAAARRAALEQRGAQPHRRRPVPVLPQIPEPARPICTPHRGALVRNVSTHPRNSKTVQAHNSGNPTCGLGAHEKRNLSACFPHGYWEITNGKDGPVEFFVGCI
jgi:hypothetical protein